MAKHLTLEVDIFGTKKKITLPVIEEKTPFGVYKLLDAREQDLPTKELLKIAKETGYPIISKNGQKYFPPNKTIRDLAKK